jgi:hypothetical protein
MDVHEPLAGYSTDRFANNLDDLFRPSLLPPPQATPQFSEPQQPAVEEKPALVYKPDIIPDGHDDAPQEHFRDRRRETERRPIPQQPVHVSEKFSAPFESQPQSGVLDMYFNKRRDMLRVLAVAMTVTLGLSMFWFAKKLFKVISSDVRHSWTPMRAVAAYASMPMTVFVVLWTLKAFFPLR